MCAQKFALEKQGGEWKKNFYVTIWQSILLNYEMKMTVIHVDNQKAKWFLEINKIDK